MLPHSPPEVCFLQAFQGLVYIPSQVPPVPHTDCFYLPPDTPDPLGRMRSELSGSWYSQVHVLAGGVSREPRNSMCGKLITTRDGHLPFRRRILATHLVAGDPYSQQHHSLVYRQLSLD